MTQWECPNCVAAHQTNDPRTITPMHQCRGLSGLQAPFIRVPPERVELPPGVRVRAVEREDYVGEEIVTENGEGRPIMSVITERADGSNDVHVFAPAATAVATNGRDS
jgi:hypothetical protein